MLHEKMPGAASAVVTNVTKNRQSPPIRVMAGNIRDSDKDVRMESLGCASGSGFTLPQHPALRKPKPRSQSSDEVLLYNDLFRFELAFFD